jgi:hypothetical protein
MFKRVFDEEEEKDRSLGLLIRRSRENF